MSGPAWRAANARAARRWRELRREPTKPEARIVRDLQQSGVARTTLEELGLVDLWEPMQGNAHALKERWGHDAAFREDIMAGLAREGVGKGAKKLFLIPLYGGGWTLPVFNEESPFIRFSLAGPVIEIAGEYLGLLPSFDSFNLSETVAAAGDAKLSQRWHRDPEDRRVVKAFIYLTDVTSPGAGPFTYVKGSHAGGRYAGLSPQLFPAGSYPPEGAVEAAVAPSDILSCLGKAGTVIFADTAGLHKGGFSTAVPRLMYTAGFVSDASTGPRKFALRSAATGLTPLARAMLRSNRRML